MFVTLVVVLLLSCLYEYVEMDYWTDRAAIIATESAMMLGSDIILKPDEEKVNKILMELKLQEYDIAFEKPGVFLPATHFFHGRDKLKQSKLFQFIQLIPKGALLHTHDCAMLSDDALFNLTYEFSDHLYACSDEKNQYYLHFFGTPNEECSWTLVSTLRNLTPQIYDRYMRKQMTLIIKNPRKIYTDINKVWSTFMKIFGTLTPFITYRPVFEKYFYLSLHELYEDNVMYVEIRGTLPPVYDLDGKNYDPSEVVQLYKDVLKTFKSDYPRFIDAKFIYAPIRLANNKTVDEYVTITKEIISRHSDFVIGFDLVGQEDLGEPLVSFKNQLEELKSFTKLFFHAGETNWYGTATDQNLIDAVLLGTQRVGHGYALLKHPAVLSLIRTNEVAIEISPISNQVLLLVEDLRNHPASMLFAQNYPVVICNDDPSFWGAKGLSFDWYMAYMGMVSRSTDLRFLKKLAINSIKYSGLDEIAKNYSMSRWELEWQDFIRNMMLKNYLNVNLL